MIKYLGVVAIGIMMLIYGYRVIISEKPVTEPNVKTAPPAGGCETFPANYESFSLSWRYGGGEPPVGDKIVLSHNESYVEAKKWSVTRRNNFTVTEAEMQALYQVLLEAEFDQIEEKERMVFDLAGTSIQAWINGEPCKKSSNSGFYITSAWRDAYGIVTQSIKDLTEKKLNEQRISVTFKFDEAIQTSSRAIRIHLNDEVILETTNHEKPAELSVKLLRGANFIEVQLLSWDEVNKSYQRTGGSEFLFFDVPPADGLVLQVALEDDDIIIENTKNVYEWNPIKN